MNEILLQTVGLKKYFKTPKGNLHAVDDINLSIEQGKTLGVVGESGCGKSTLGRTILLLLAPTEGKVLYRGEDIVGYGRKKQRGIHRRMQIIFQDPYASLNPRMTLGEIIADPMMVYKTVASRKEAEKKVRELMDTVGLASRFINAYPHELDGGRRQRIGVARALSLDPEFIISDEPVSALDVSIQAQILNLLMDLQEERGLTYLFITHDLSVVKHISDEIMVMYLGICVEKAPSQKLFENPLHPYTRELLNAIPIPSLAPKQSDEWIRGEVTSPINPPQLPLCRQVHFGLRQMHPGTSPDTKWSWHFVACTM